MRQQSEARGKRIQYLLRLLPGGRHIHPSQHEAYGADVGIDMTIRLKVKP